MILDFLGTKPNIFLSLSTLKRRLRNAGLTRRTDYTPIGTVNAAITHELTGSGQLLGYRALWQTLRQKYFLTVKRDDVMLSIRRLDPLEFNFAIDTGLCEEDTLQQDQTKCGMWMGMISSNHLVLPSVAALMDFLGK